RYETHWAYQPVTRPPVPQVRDAMWPTNAVDRLMLHRLEQVQLAPAQLAEPHTLVRRLAFGLTGLPPSPEEVAAFASDPTSAAWTALIDKYLASTAYGEQWARHWMDLTRYADSAGYELDYLFAHSHRYRDWLIRSFQSNKPLDRFLHEQL